MSLLASCTGQKKQSTDSDNADAIDYIWMAEELPDLCVSGDEGVAGAILNIVGEQLTIWGGANFPDKPAADGGKKRIWDCCYTLTENGWEQQPERTPIAYAATCTVPSPDGEPGIAVIGGNNGEGLLGNAIIWTGKDETIDIPCACRAENAAAAYGDGYIYYVGGTCMDEEQGVPLPTQKAWRIHIPSEGAEWEQLPDLPQSPRVQCSAAWLDGRLYVAGGYDPTDGTVNGTLISWAPGEDEWTFVDSLRKPGELQTWTLIGGTMLADATTHRLLFVGGVDATIFQEAISRPARLLAARNENNRAMIERLERETAEYMHHEAEWYKFNDELISYNLNRHEYRHEVSHPSLARAGAAVLMRDSVIYVVNGELKPGIRSKTAVKLTRHINQDSN